MTKHSTVSLPSGNTVIEVVCTDCQKTKTFYVSTAGYDKWIKGELIQRAMPEVAEDDREILISGQCGPCFDAMFPEDE